MARLNPRPEIASLWRDTASPPQRFAALEGERRADVVIVGGGYTGLNAARRLGQRGIDAVVLEASRIGWGASGRNGGVVSGKYRLTFSDIARRFGLDTARRMHDIGCEAITGVAELVEAFGIADAGWRESGNLRCAHNVASLEGLRAESAWLHDTLGDKATRILDAAEMRAETGSSAFTGGLLNSHGGVIHPLNFVRGVARGVAASGAALHEESPVTGIRRDGADVLVATERGAVRARQVILATNAYSDLSPATGALPRTLIPFRSAMIATAPLTGTAGERLIPTGRSYTETRRMMRWFRKAGDRMLFGGRGAFGREDSDAAFAALHKALVAQFPELAGTAITHRWSGLVALTLDSLPHVGRIDDRISYAVGYNGTGVAMSTLMGRYVADIALGERPDIGLMATARLKTVPFYAVREPAVRLVAGWYQFLDAIGR